MQLSHLERPDCAFCSVSLLVDQDQFCISRMSWFRVHMAHILLFEPTRKTPTGTSSSQYQSFLSSVALTSDSLTSFSRQRSSSRSHREVNVSSFQVTQLLSCYKKLTALPRFGPGTSSHTEGRGRDERTFDIGNRSDDCNLLNLLKPNALIDLLHHTCTFPPTYPKVALCILLPFCPGLPKKPLERWTNPT